MVKENMFDKGSSQGSEQDRISQLHNDLRCHILSFLSTKDAVRTSVLSTKWRNLWQLVLGLDLDARDFGLGLDICHFSKNTDDFVMFVDRFLYFHRESCIHKLQLHFSAVGSVDYASFLTTWIDAATTRRVQRIDLHCEHRYKVAVPLSLYTSETLVHLQLVRVNLVSAEFVSLPCLKILHLEYVNYSDRTTLEKLISNSPVLEDLIIIKYSKDNIEALQVRSQTLKRVDIDQFSYYDQQYGLVIDAPLLQSLRITTYSIKNITFINLGSIDNVVIGGFLLSTLDPNDLSSRSMSRDFITIFSRVRSLILCYDASKDIFHYLKSEPLHQFCHLSKLSATCDLSDLEMLPNFLKSCPQLEYLYLRLSLSSFSQRLFDPERNKKAEVVSSTVPPCLVSSLKFVELVCAQLFGCGTELKVARYFLENSTILEKLSIRNDYKKKNVKLIRQKLHAIPRCSSTCEVILL